MVIYQWNKGIKLLNSWVRPLEVYTKRRMRLPRTIMHVKFLKKVQERYWLVSHVTRMRLEENYANTVRSARLRKVYIDIYKQW